MNTPAPGYFAFAYLVRVLASNPPVFQMLSISVEG